MPTNALNPPKKTCLFSDVHANLEALQAVLEDSREQGCVEYVCIGDVIGYNADPAACIEVVRGLDCPCVKGNHDEMIQRDIEKIEEEFNPNAAAAIIWTLQQLNADQRRWLEALNYVRQHHGYTLVHASLDTPATWNYIGNRFDALAHFSFQYTALCFYGHTHVPRIFEKNSTESYSPTEILQIKPEKKYLINVGSVGQPRDGNWQASYAIYDAEQKTVEIRRIPYDIDTAQQKIRAAKLPDVLAQRLALGK